MLSPSSPFTRFDIFQNHRPDELQRLEAVSTVVRFKRGHVFYNPDEQAENFFTIVEGQVILSRMTVEGRRLIIAILERGAIFGETVLTAQRSYAAYAEAVTDCTIAVISRKDVMQLLLADAHVAAWLLQALAERLGQLETSLEELAFLGVRARLAALLLRLAVPTTDGGLRVNGLTHQQLAELVGSHRETATVALNQFRSQGLITLGRKRIDVLAREALLAVAQG